MRKTISFTDEYEKEFEHLCAKDNPSLYVRQLIRKDRLNKKTNLEERLEILISRLENRSIQIYSSEPRNKSKLKERALKGILDME